MTRIVRKVVEGRACIACTAWKPIDYFGIRSGSTRRSVCKACRNAREKDANRVRINRLRKSNPKPFRDRNRRYREANKAKIRANYKAWRLRTDYKRDPDSTAAAKHKLRAKKTGAGGSFTKEQWLRLKAKFDHKCAACGAAVRLQVDHIISIANGGVSDISNIQPLCRSCNRKKGADTTDYRTQRRLKL